MKSRWLIVTLLVAFGLLAFAGVVFAQDEEVPPPYTGLTNPYAWDDQAAIDAGQAIYAARCQACHGATGSNIPPFDFGADAFHEELEASPDFVYYIITEGRMSGGMPGYKATLSDDERWQLVTYMDHIGEAGPEPTATAEPTAVPTTPSGEPKYQIEIIVPDGLTTGRGVLFNAFVTDDENQPVADATVTFYVAASFQNYSGDMEIGVGVTDDGGQAVLDYVPRIAGDTVLTAKYGGVTATQDISIADSGIEEFYETEIGLHLPAGGPEVNIGGPSSKGIDAEGNAPSSALRLPGGLFSWLWLYVIVVGGVWLAYIIIMYQVIGISKEGDRQAKIVPVGGMLLVLFVAAVVILMILIGPYSQFHV